MYESFFRFSERPFAVLPDSRRIFWTDGHRNAFSVLEVGFERLSQVTVLTGGIGTGKTTLIRHLLQTASGAYSVGLLSNFAGARCDLLAWVLSAFGLDVSGSSEARKFHRLQTYLEGELQQGRRSVLVVDEAQNLSGRDLESLRLLSNMNAETVLMMLVLVGQPQLRAKLTHIENQRLCQRIGADYHLGPLSQQETADFVRYRCVQAGGSPTLFAEEALDEVHRVSGGIPRKINVLCDLSLVSAYSEGVRNVDSRIVRSVVEDARRHGTYMSLTEGDTVDIAEADAAAGTGNEPDLPVRDAIGDPVQRLGAMREFPDGGPRGQPVACETGADDEPPASHGRATPVASAPADSARLNALFDMDWSDDTLLCLHDPAKEDAASAPSVAQADAPTSADSLVGAAQPAWDDRESGRSGSAPHRADDGDDLPTRQAAAGAEPVLHDVPVPHPMSAPASAARPGRGELALRQAFGRRPSWRRTGWRGAAVAAIAGGGSMAAGIAIALLPDGTAPMRQPATEARQASPEHVAVAEARTLSVAMVHTAAADAASVGTAPRGGSSAPSGTAVAEEPPDTDDWARYSPVTLAYEDPHDDAPAASAIRTISSLRTEAAGPSARPAGAVAGNSLPSLPQRSAADRQPNGSGKPRGLGTPAEAADSIPSIAYLHGDAASPLNLRPGDDVTAFAAPHPIPPAPQAVAEANAAHAGSGAMPWPDAAAPAAAASGVQAAPVHRTSKAQAPDSVTSEAEPAFTSVASGSQAGVPPDAVPQIIATRSPPPPGSDPEALFRDAVDIALEDPRAAVVGYARAALLGHSRAAYYLGQIYETGDGVPVDYAIARHWYEAASEGNRRAENRLSDLPRPQDGGMEAPLPLLAQPLDAGEADFVWTSGEGADPTSYVVEISLNPGVGADAAYAVSGSAARLPLVEGATHWRVLALQATDKRSTASDWRALSPVGSDRSAAAEMRPDHL